MLHTKILKLFDKWFGPFFLNFCHSPHRLGNQTLILRKILVIRPGGIGDAALLVPVLRGVSLAYPGIIMDIVCESRNAGIFRMLPFVSGIYLYHNPKAVLALFFKKYDVIIDTEQSHYLSAVLVGLLRGVTKAGFKGGGREKIFHVAVDYEQEQYEAVVFRDLFHRLFSFPHKRMCLPPFVKRPDPGLVDVFHGALPGKDNKMLVCLFPGATIDERLWPENRWAEIIAWLDKNGYQPLLLGGQREIALCKSIAVKSKIATLWNMAGRLSLLETAWLLERTRLLISTDSGILHLGGISNVATVSLFGPGREVKWAPRGDNHIALNKHLPCSPCTLFGETPFCSRKSCMLAISTDDVKRAIKKLLKI